MKGCIGEDGEKWARKKKQWVFVSNRIVILNTENLYHFMTEFRNVYQCSKDKINEM